MRELTIKVVIDDTFPTCVRNYERTVDGSYKISINPNELITLDAKPLVVVAHELGHVLGMEFELTHHQNLKYLSPRTAYASGEVLNIETEAWDVAEQMLKTRTMAMDHYIQSVQELQKPEILKQQIRYRTEFFTYGIGETLND